MDYEHLKHMTEAANDVGRLADDGLGVIDVLTSTNTQTRITSYNVCYTKLLRSEIENTRIAMMGVSMGGFTTYRATVLDKRIKVAIPIISSPVWGDLPENYPANEEPHIIASLKHLSKQYAPSNFIDKFYPTALLMQVGGDDKHFDLNKLKHRITSYNVCYTKLLRRSKVIYGRACPRCESL